MKMLKGRIMACVIAASLGLQMAAPIVPAMAAEYMTKSVLAKEAGITDIALSTASDAAKATMANALLLGQEVNYWNGFTYSEPAKGEGTKLDPYQISSVGELKWIAYMTANEDVDGFRGTYFKMTKDIALGNQGSWLPIGYFRTSSDSEPYGFHGDFDGGGHVVSGLRISGNQRYVGLFGMLAGAEVRNLTVDGIVAASDKAGILAGEINDSIVENCLVKGQVKANGVLGGIAGEVYDGVIENCTNRAGIFGGTDPEGVLDAYAGGIAGSLHNGIIVNSISDTSDSAVNVYAEGAVGGIAGNLDSGEICNCYVEGKIGSTIAEYIGGIVGRMQSGKVKVCRFAGTIGASTSGKLQVSGNFIGTIVDGNTEVGEDLSYLYTDSEDKYSIKPFGDKLNSQIRLEHHIGAYYANQRDFSLYQLAAFTKQVNRYFYEELEEGVLQVGNDLVSHWAPSKTGDPVTGHLIQVPEIEHGSISVMEAANTYAKEINWANPGAVAEGSKVIVYTSPSNELDKQPPVYYELKEDSLRWISEDGGYEIVNTNTSDIHFTMPSKGITVTAAYRAMTNGVVLDQTELTLEVEHIRSGSRWEPAIGWKVNDPVQLTASVIPESAANKNVYWGVKDTDGSYTDVISVDQDGVITVNKDAKWIVDLIGAAVQNQTMHPSKPMDASGTAYGTVTVTTEAGSKRASCLVTVKFKVSDHTVVPVSGVKVNPTELSFEVERRLTGNRLDPVETIKVTPSQRLYETITPEYADNKTVSWNSGSDDMLSVTSDGLVHVNGDARWIGDLIRLDDERLRVDPYAECSAFGSQAAYVTVTAKDGGHQAVCAVNVNFKTVDETVVHAEGVDLNHHEMKFEIIKHMIGSRRNPTVTYEITNPQLLEVKVRPDQAFNKNIIWNVNDANVLWVDQGGMVEVNGDSQWIRDILAEDEKKLAANPYEKLTGSGIKTAYVTATAEDGGFRDNCKVTIQFATKDETIVHAEGVSLDHEALVYEIEVTKTGRRTSPIYQWRLPLPQQLKAQVLPDCADNIDVFWETDTPNVFKVVNGTVTIQENSEWMEAVMTEYPYTGVRTGKVSARTADGGYLAECAVKVTFKVTDHTYSGNSSSGGNSSGASAVVEQNAAAVSVGARGSWEDEDGRWTFRYLNGTRPISKWEFITWQNRMEWYRFDQQGRMVTGWFTDADGNEYFLHNKPDGTQGHMYTGWKQIEGIWHYFKELSDGTKGALQREVPVPEQIGLLDMTQDTSLYNKGSGGGMD